MGASDSVSQNSDEQKSFPRVYGCKCRKVGRILLTFIIPPGAWVQVIFTSFSPPRTHAHEGRVRFVRFCLFRAWHCVTFCTFSSPIRTRCPHPSERKHSLFTPKPTENAENVIKWYLFNINLHPSLAALFSFLVSISVHFVLFRSKTLFCPKPSKKPGHHNYIIFHAVKWCCPNVSERFGRCNYMQIKYLTHVVRKSTVFRTNTFHHV